MADNQQKQRQRTIPIEQVNFVNTFNRIFLTILNEICCIDLLGTSGSSSRNRGRRRRSTAKRDEKLVNEEKKKRPRARLTWITRLQNSSSLSTTSSSPESVLSLFQRGELNNNASEHELKLLKRMQESRQMLVTIGASGANKSIVFESVHLYLTALGLITFGGLNLFYRHVSPFDLYQYREQIDAARERHSIQLLVKRVVAQYCESNRLFAREHSRRHNRAADKHKVGKLASAIYINRISGYNDAAADANNVLASMLSSGALMPENMSPYWTKKRAQLFFALTNSLALFVLIYFLTLAKNSTQAPLLTSLVDISTRGLVLSVSFGSFTIGLGTYIASIDQIVLVNKIHKLIDQCTQVNSVSFIKYSESYEQSNPVEHNRMGQAKLATCLLTCGELPVREMNENLLFTLMQYKIFARQLRPIIKTLNPAPIAFWSALLLVPVLIRLHMPYLEFCQARDNRYMLASYCLAMLFPVDFGMLPLHHLNTRCAHLYKSLSSLSAHIIEIECKQGGNSVYDSHAVLSLVKELDDPDRFLDQFVTRCAGLSGTYSILVRVHFWWGLVMISILIGTQSNGAGLFDSFLSDPFNAFSSEG